jgi:tRNA uridine 5-carboxymethylaminomethyl modification enzyme
MPDISVAVLATLAPELDDVSRETSQQVERDALYANYLSRQENDAKTLNRDENLRIPSDFDYGSLQGLSNELRGKLSGVRPETIAQAARIQGMTPSALTLILTHLRRSELKKSA